MGFAPYSDYKVNKNCTSEEIINIMPEDKGQLQSDFFDGSTLGGVSEPTRFSFGWNKPPGFKNCFEPETIAYGKIEHICIK